VLGTMRATVHARTVSLLVVLALVAGCGGHVVARPADLPRGASSRLVAARHAVAVLAAQLSRAQATIDAPDTSAPAVTHAGELEQVAVFRLANAPPARRRAVLAALHRPATSEIGADLRATSDLGTITAPLGRLPPWRIINPPPPMKLRDLFVAGSRRYGVSWQTLAAIEFVETRFGRVLGPSSAGAQGPMQFEPATWAEYGHGSINDPRAAIPAAARFLRANGAARDLPNALLHYNHSIAYVQAVETYAGVMRRDPRAFLGLYAWQVLVAGPHGRALILPVGFPRVRPRWVSTRL
jgi:soluble lytic murein transglycosylase-like protein